MLSHETNSPGGGLASDQFNNFDFVNADGSGLSSLLMGMIGSFPVTLIAVLDAFLSRVVLSAEHRLRSGSGLAYQLTLQPQLLHRKPFRKYLD
jgi:hypothetical protein